LILAREEPDVDGPEAQSSTTHSHYSTVSQQQQKTFLRKINNHILIFPTISDSQFIVLSDLE
jgi:hypothetical protein